MAVKKAKASGKSEPAEMKLTRRVKKAKSIRPTPRQRQALEVVRRAVADGDYDLLMTVDKDTLRTLFEKKLVQFPQVQRPAVKGSVSRESIRKALLAVEKERGKIGTASGA